jgi:hypothetical protein
MVLPHDVTPEMLLHNPALLLHAADPEICKYYPPLLFSFVGQHLVQ